MSKPTVLFFAGAFADPSCFDSLSLHLQTLGYPTAYAHVLTLNPSDPTSVSTSQDAQYARNEFLLPLIEENKEVIIFAHSYGGVVGGQAAYGLSRISRTTEGKSGGVIGLIYLAGNIVPEGETLLQAVGGAYPPFIKQNYPSKALAVIDPIMSILYNGVDPACETELQAAMIPHALAAFETAATLPAWAESAYDGRRTYIRTLDDQCNPLFVQDLWIQSTSLTWEIKDMKTGHCPFINKPEEVAEIVRDLVEQWN